MDFKIAVIKGDGVGPEIMDEGIKILERIGEKFGHVFHIQEVLAGGCAIDAVGECLPQTTLDVCKSSDAVLLGAVGGPKWDHVRGEQRPEKALLRLRESLGLYANLRPAMIHRALSDACPIKREIIGDDLDILIVRELTGGIYFGERGYREGKYGVEAYDTDAYSEFEVKRIAKIAFEAAMNRSKRLTSVDKANVLESSRLWRSVMDEVAKDYPQVAVDHMYVDNAAMQLIRNPKHFDVLVTNNMFGDILSDEASQITGSIGMLPSASLGEGSFGMYEPIHGSAPDIAGRNTANPIATVLSVAMMLRYTLELPEEAREIESAVTSVLNAGYRTADIAVAGETITGTKEMGEQILNQI